MFVEYSLRVPKRCLFLRLKNYFCGRLLSLRLMMCLQPKGGGERKRGEEKEREREGVGEKEMLATAQRFVFLGMTQTFIIYLH